MRVALLTSCSIDRLANLYRDVARRLDVRRPVQIGDHERLYCEMVWAIGRFRFGEDFNRAVRAAGYGAPAEPTDEERGAAA